MFLKGIIVSTARSDITVKGQKRQKLSCEYSFNGIKICNSAFLGIYGLGTKHWKNLRKHYIQNDINPAGESYSFLYRIYRDEIETTGNTNPIHLTTFWRIWKKYIPEIKFLSSCSDLCFLCKSMRFGVKFWQSRDIEKKVIEWQQHISWAQEERNYYK